MPWTMEGAVMPDREAPVRECSLDPAWTECVHFGDLRVTIGDPRLRSKLSDCSPHSAYGSWRVVGPYRGRLGKCPICGATTQLPVDGYASVSDFKTEAEARAEFDRRVALMLGREVA